MSDFGNSDNPYPIIDPRIMREIDFTRSDCKRRHDGTCEIVRRHTKQLAANKELLIEISGRSGNNGKLGKAQQDIADQKANHAILETKVASDHEVVAKLQLGQVRYSAAGGLTGGGAVVGLIELIRYLL